MDRGHHRLVARDRVAVLQDRARQVAGDRCRDGVDIAHPGHPFLADGDLHRRTGHSRGVDQGGLRAQGEIGARRHGQKHCKNRDALEPDAYHGLHSLVLRVRTRSRLSTRRRTTSAENTATASTTMLASAKVDVSMTNGMRNRSLDMPFDHSEREQVAEQPAERLGEQRHDTELDQENAGDLGAGKAEHAQAGEFARALGELDAGGVVGDAEGDDDGEHDVNAHAHRDVAGDGFAEPLPRDVLQRDAGDGGQVLDGAVESAEPAFIEHDARARDPAAVADEPVERSLVHIDGEPDIALHDGADRHHDDAAVIMRQFHLDHVAGVARQGCRPGIWRSSVRRWAA